MNFYYINTSEVSEEDKHNMLSELDLSIPTIVEGCDLVGKDTILSEINALVDDGEVLHHTAKDDNSYPYWVDIYMRNLSNTNNRLNRCHISTDIYELVLNDAPKLTGSQSTALMHMMDAEDVNFILVDCSYDDLVGRYSSRGDDYITNLDDLVSIYLHYKLVIAYYIKAIEPESQPYNTVVNLINMCNRKHKLHDTLNLDEYISLIESTTNKEDESYDKAKS